MFLVHYSDFEVCHDNIQTAAAQLSDNTKLNNFFQLDKTLSTILSRLFGSYHNFL